MKTESTKLYISIVAQIPVSLALLVLACVQLCCTYIESRLKRLIAQPAVSLKDISGSESQNTSFDDIDSLMLWLSVQEADCIEWVRMAYEDNRAMREVIGLHPDQKLYAVLRPTKTENLQRIEWMLRAWPNQYSHWLIDCIKSGVVGFEALRLKPVLKNSDLPMHI